MLAVILLGFAVVFARENSRLLEEVSTCCATCYEPNGNQDPCTDIVYGGPSCGCQKGKIKVGGDGSNKNRCVRPKQCPNNPCKNKDCGDGECKLRKKNGKVKGRCVDKCSKKKCKKDEICVERYGVCVPDDNALCAAVTCFIGYECIDGVCVPLSCKDNVDACPVGTVCNVITDECEPVNCAAITCPVGSECNPNNGECDPVITCANILCDIGYRCNPLTVSCEPINCAAITCPVGTICNEGNGNCDDLCDTNEIFKLCSSACEPSCNNISPICILSCQAPACQCKDGLVRRPDGECVNPSQCPCATVRCGLGFDCINDVDDDGNAIPNCCGVIGEEYRECASACEPTCAEPSPVCTRQCLSARCQCRFGKVRGTNGDCIDVGDCP